MTKIYLSLFLVFATTLTAQAQKRADDVADARTEISPLLEALTESANAHDAETHLSFYAQDSTLTFIFNDQVIVGWDALLEQQRQWWRDGDTDIYYEPVDDPDFQVYSPSLVITTLSLESRMTTESEQVQGNAFNISLVWQKRPEGWRVVYAHESMVSR